MKKAVRGIAREGLCRLMWQKISQGLPSGCFAIKRMEDLKWKEPKKH